MLKAIFQKISAGSRKKIRRRAEIEFELAKQKLINEALGIETWDILITSEEPVNPTTPVSWSQEFRYALGFSDENDFPDMLGSWSGRLHPDDKVKTLTELSFHITDHSGKTPFDVEYRLMLKTGEYRRYHAFGTTLRNSRGHARKMTIAQVDISAKRQLERMIVDNRDIIEKKNKALNIQRNLVTSLLTGSKDILDKTLIRNMKLIGKFLRADRVQIWRNDIVDANMLFILSHEWVSDYGKQLANIPDCKTLSYDDVPDWEDKLKRGKNINGAVEDLLPHEKSFLSRFQVNSLAVLPLFSNDGFWGFMRIDNCRDEVTFSELEIVDLTQLGQLMAFIIVLSEDYGEIFTERANKMELAHRYKSILDAIPTPISVTDAGMALTFINSAFESLIGKEREKLYGKQCSTLGFEICGTSNCAVVCSRRFVNKTSFKKDGKSYKVDVSQLKDLSGETVGFVEVIQDVTDLK